MSAAAQTAQDTPTPTYPMRRDKRKQAEDAGLPDPGMTPAQLTLAAIPHPATAPPIPQPKPWTETAESMMTYMVAMHMSPISAAQALGYHEQTFSRWMDTAASYEDSQTAQDATGGDFHRPAMPDYAAACLALRERLKSAWAYAEQASLARIGAAPAWQAHAWLLERTRQSRYALQTAAPAGAVSINIGVIAASQGQAAARVTLDVGHVHELPDPRRPQPALAAPGAIVQNIEHSINVPPVE